MLQHAVRCDAVPCCSMPCCISARAAAAGLAQEHPGACPCPGPSLCVALMHRRLGSPLPNRSPRGLEASKRDFHVPWVGVGTAPPGSHPLADRRTDLPGAGALLRSPVPRGASVARHSRGVELGNAHGARDRAAWGSQDVQGWGRGGLWCPALSSWPRLLCPGDCSAWPR